MRQAKRTRIPVQVQMNDNAARFYKDILVRSPYELLWNEKRSALLLHPRQTFFRQNRFFDTLRLPPFNQTSPYIRHIRLLAGYEINHDQILVFRVQS
jgi:hypothetical protein